MFSATSGNGPPSPEAHARYLFAALKAVQEVEGLLLSERPSLVMAKGDRDKVTDLDVRAQSMMRARLARSTPEAGFLGEEVEDGIPVGPSSIDRLAWVADPLDGTGNYVREIPMWAVSLALVDRGEPLVAVVSAPFLGSRYHAVAGEGAFVNGRRIRAGGSDALSDCFVTVGDFATGVGSVLENRRRLSLVGALADRAERVRLVGSAALDLAWVAEGRTDACVIWGAHPWDTAGGILLCRESGATVSDPDGSPAGIKQADIVAASPQIALAVKGLVASTSR